jgi:hypothetical protein
MVIDMPASFPSSVKTWANKQDNIDDVFAGDINGTYHEIIAIENELMQVGYKPSARVATTQNGDLATAFANGQTVDGIVLSTGDRILIKDQTSGAENGIYIVNASGAPSRAIDANTAAHMVPGLMVYVREGAVNGKGTWKLTTTGTITLGTTPLTFENELASHKAETAADDDVHGLRFKGCMITLAAAQPIPNTTATVVTWGAEFYDTNTFHNLVTNPSRITIPAGVTKVRLIANIQFISNAVGYRSVNIIKNGSATEPGKPNISQNAVNGTVTSLNISSPVLPVVEGDYFEVQVTQTSGDVLNIQNGDFRTWFAMEVIQ